MKVLQVYQGTLSFVITRDDNGIKSFRYIGILSVYGFGVISLIQFLISEAQTFQDYSESVYPLSTILTDFFVVIIYVWKKEQIFKLVDDLENAIEEREL